MMIKLILFFIIGFLLSSFVHEIGHMVMALILGWRFNFIVFGPLKLSKEENSTKIKVSIEKDITLWGGIASTIPNKPGDAGINDFRKILVAGPLLSVLLGMLLLLAFSKVDSILILMIASESLGMGLISILPIPMRTGFMYTDGYRYWRLIRNDVSRMEEEALFNLSILELFEGEVSLEEAKAIAEPLVNASDNKYRYYAFYYLHNLAIRNDLVEERIILIEKLMGIAKMFQRVF